MRKELKFLRASDFWLTQFFSYIMLIFNEMIVKFTL